MSSGNELGLGKFGKQGQINTDSLKGGVKREVAEKAGFANIFDAFDDGNGVLTDNEINTLKQGITDASKHGKDSIFSQNEAEQYIQQYNQNAQANNQKTLTDVNAQKLFDFLKFIEQQTNSVMSSTVDSNNNTVTKYKNESGQEVTEIIHNDTKTTEQVVVANGKEIRTFLNAEGKKEKEIETDPQTGAVMTTIYGADGKTIKTKTAEEKSGKKIITEYKKADGEEDAKPIKATIINGSTVEEQTLVNGELKTTHRIENKGKSNQKDVEIKYDNNGRTETVTENGQTYTVEYIGSNRVITKKNGTTQDVTTEDGKKKEVITTENSNDVTTNIYNANNNARLSQTKVIKGKEYSVTYDGNGNTTGIVVQYGEDAEKIAKKFGITKEALLKANGKNENEDFNVGDVITIPKELEADDKNVKGRKSSADAIKDKQRADERARQREIARQKAIALDKQYRAAGLKNYEHKGEKFQYGNETYTVIGTMNNRARLMVKDSKGNIVIASHDHKILKDSYVQMTTAYDKAEKVTMRNGQKVAVLNSRGDKHGRMIGIDEHGRQVVISGGKSKTDLSDRVVLDNSYVEASDVRDIVTTRIETAKDDNERKAVISQNRSYSSENIIRCKGKNGKVWYFDLTTGKAVNLTKQEAAAITKELDDAAGGMGTDEAKLAKANSAIVDPAVLAEINKYYESQGYTAGEYKSAYEAFLASEISDSEIYEANADLVNNNAILDQARRDEILLTNLTTFGGESANRNKALRAIGTRTDYNNLQSSLAKHNKANGYNSHFKGQNALQTTLYNVTNGNVVEIDAANRALIDSNEKILDYDEIIRIQAEVGAMYLEKGDSSRATRTQDAEVLALMNTLTTADGQKIDVNAKAKKADLIIAGYGEYSNEEIAKEAIHYLTMAIKSYGEVEREFSNPYMDAQFGHHGSSSTHQSAEDYGAKAFQLIRNYEVLQLVKKELGSKYDEYIAKINHETNGITDFSKLQLGVSTPSDLSQAVINENLTTLSGLKVAVSDLEKSHLDKVDEEGWKQDLVNELRQTLYLGATRADVANQYAMSKSTISRLELAAKGQLVDANGKKISFEDAVKELTGKTVQELQALNQEYVTQQAYGEMALDATVGLVTMVIPVPGLGIGKLVSVGGKLYKVAQVVNAAKNEYKLVNVAINGMEAAAKMKAVQYTMDRTNIATSVSGDTLENRGAVEDKSDEVAMYSAAGVVAGGATSILSSRMSSTLGRATVNGLGFGADLASSAYISQQFHGGNFSDYLRLTNQDGSLNTANVLNTFMTGVGYGQGLRTGGHAPELPPVKPQEVVTPHLDAISKNAKPHSVYIKTEEKFKTIRDEVDAKLKTATDADLDALKQQVDVIQNRDMRHELEQMIEAKRADINKPVAETPVENVRPEETIMTPEQAYMRATGGTPESPVVSAEFAETFSEKTQKLFLENLPVGGSAIAHKGDYSYIIKNNNGNIEITNRMDHSELCRVAGNDGKELPLFYMENSASVRLFFNNHLDGHTFAPDFATYKSNIETAHKLAYGGATGDNLYYMKNGKLLKMEAGKEHQYSQLSNNYVEKAQDVDAIAHKYGDEYSSEGISSPKLEGITADALPVNMFTQHKYPDAKHLDQYFQQMYRTAEEANQMIKRGINTPSEKKAFLEKLAEHYQYAANARPFEQINNSLFMNELNTMLAKAGMSTMPHGILDHAAQRLQPDSFKKYFIDQYKETALGVDPHTVTSANDMPVYNSRMEQVTSTVAHLPANIAAKVSKLPDSMKESFSSISTRIKNLPNNIGEYISIKNAINKTFAPVVEVKNYLLDSLETAWNKVKEKAKAVKAEWKNIRPNDRAEIKDQLVNDLGDAVKDVIDELPIPAEYKHILTDAIDGGQMMYNGSHIRNSSDLVDFSIEDCGDYIKNMLRDMDIDPSVKAEIMDGIDSAQQSYSQMSAYRQAAVEPQSRLIDDFDDGVIDISQERMYHVADNDAEFQSADLMEFDQQNNMDNFIEPDGGDFLGL